MGEGTDRASRYGYWASAMLALIILLVFLIKVFPSAFSYNTIPQDVERTSKRLSSAERFVMTGRIDINRADIEGLSILPGIGRGLAARIIRRREELGGFASVDDLLEVEGIGAGKLASIKAFLRTARTP